MRTYLTRTLSIVCVVPLAGCAAGIDFEKFSNECSEEDGFFDNELSSVFCSGDWGEGESVEVIDPPPPDNVTVVAPVAARFENFVAVGVAAAQFGDGALSGCPSNVNYGVTLYGVDDGGLVPQLRAVFVNESVQIGTLLCSRLSSPTAWVPTTIEVLDVQSSDSTNATGATIALGAGELGLYIASLSDGAGSSVTRIPSDEFEPSSSGSIECTDGVCVIDGTPTETTCDNRLACLSEAGRQSVNITGLAALSTRTLLVGTGVNGLWRVSVEDNDITELGGTAQAIHYRPSLQPEFDLVWVADVDPTVGVSVYRAEDLNTSTADSLAPLNSAPLPATTGENFAITDMDARTNRGFAIGRSITQDGTALAQLIEFRIDDERISVATPDTVRVGFSPQPTVGFVDADTICVGLPEDGLQTDDADGTLQLKVYDANNPGTVDSDAPIVSRNFTRLQTGGSSPRRGAHTSLGLILTTDGRTVTPFDFSFVRE